MKLSEMREKTADELQNAIVDWKKQLLESRLQLSSGKLENTASISKTKRLIAQAKTILTEKSASADAEVKMPKKEKQGIVVSNKMDKTVVVKVADYEPHPKYKKIIESNKNYKAHDAENVCSEGDIVRIVENRPISSGKRWVVAEVVEKAR